MLPQCLVSSKDTKCANRGNVNKGEKSLRMNDPDGEIAKVGFKASTGDIYKDLKGNNDIKT